MKKFKGIFISAVLIALIAMSAVSVFADDLKETTGEYFDNSVITTRVKTAILSEPTLKVMQINVDSFKGTVQLSGFVDTLANSRLAEDIASKVSGVKTVKNDLIVK